MRKNYIKSGLFLYYILLAGIVYSQPDLKDTIFLLRENYPDYYRVVFIDTHSNSDYYNIIETNRYNRLDSSAYFDTINFFKKVDPENSQNISPEIPRDWRTLKKYQGNFYLYAPGEWGNNYWVHLGNNILFEWTFNDGSWPLNITSIKAINKNLYQVALSDIYTGSRILNIHLIDSKRLVAVFEDTSIKGEDRFTLMVAASSIRNYPIIVNYCKNQKCFEEFEFDKPDYPALIRNAQ